MFVGSEPADHRAAILMSMMPASEPISWNHGPGSRRCQSAFTRCNSGVAAAKQRARSTRRAPLDAVNSNEIDVQTNRKQFAG